MIVIGHIPDPNILTTSLSEFLGRKTPRQLQRIIRFLAFSAFYVSHDCFQAKQWENVQCVHWIPETHHRCCEWPWNWWDFLTGALEECLEEKIKLGKIKNGLNSKALAQQLQLSVIQSLPPPPPLSSRLLPGSAYSQRTTICWRNNVKSSDLVLDLKGRLLSTLKGADKSQRSTLNSVIILF